MQHSTGILLAFVSCVLSKVSGHGMLWDPPNRSSMWRFGYSVPPNYDDNQNFCGGRSVQWDENGGKCGICGDNFADPTPRKNEVGGRYGANIIGKVYPADSVIQVIVRLTAPHKGFFTFSLCNLDEEKESEECFRQIFLADGSDRFPKADLNKDYAVSLQLPAVKCLHCVLRWHYTTGNNYGQCADGSWATGCGPQENFRSCSDISIL